MYAKYLKVVAFALMATLATGCASDTGNQSQTTASNSRGTSNTSSGNDTLTVMAGSEVKDMEPILADLAKETGVTLDLKYGGTLEGIDQIESGSATPDLAWFAQDKYFQLVDSKRAIKASEKTMVSPVVLGVKTSIAQELGWRNGVTTWKDIEKAVAAKRFRYAMTSPATSNSGFSAVVGITTAFAGTGDAAKTKDVDIKRLTTFFSGQKMTSGSSGWLADAYLRDESSVDGIINYESVILDLSKRAKSPLTIIAPKDGTIIADYPLVLLNSVKRASYEKVVAWLKTPAVQKRIMQTTHRRSINPSVALDPEFGKGILYDTPFPASRGTIDAMILAFVNERRVPAHTYYVLDKTGSMDSSDGGDGETRIEQVKKAMYVLTGSDSSVSGRLARFENREVVTIIEFSDRPDIDNTFTMKRTNDPQVYGNVRSIVDMVKPGGGTAIYSALETAINQSHQDTSGRYQSIVLMTDGENNLGESADDFIDHYVRRHEKIHVFAIGIGDSHADELERIATTTGGKYFDGRTDDLAKIFQEIRGYQ